MSRELTPYEQWQLEKYGSYLPENEVEETENDFEIREPINTNEINGDDDFSFHPDWAYE